MSLYDIKLQRVEDAIILKCKETFTENFNSQFSMWVSLDASCEIPNIYSDEFNKEFIQYMDDTDNTVILIMGSNLVYHIDTVTTIQKNITLNKLIQYMTIFIKAQLEDFSNACDHIQMSMYYETHPDTEAIIQQPLINNSNEDDPSST